MQALTRALTTYAAGAALATGAVACDQCALDRAAGNHFSPGSLQNAVLVRRGQRCRAIGPEDRPGSDAPVGRELPGQVGLTVTQLGVRPFRLAVLVGRLDRDLAVDVLLECAVRSAALVLHFRQHHAGVVPLAPPAVPAISDVIALDELLAAREGAIPVGDERERVHRLAVQEDVQLHQLRLSVAAQLVIERRVPAAHGLQAIEEVENHLGERQLELDRYVPGRVMHALLDAALYDAQLNHGAQVLLRATASTLEQQLISLDAPSGYLRQATPTTPTGDKKALQGIGDLVILLNPATEASAYHRLHLLSMGLQYQETQTPVMLTISTDNDYARYKLFTIGRVLGEIFTTKPRKADEVEREAERKALGIDGEHVHHVTHRLEPVDSRERLIKEEPVLDALPGCDEDGECRADWRVWAELKDRRILEEVPSRDDTQADRERLRGFDFAGQVRLGNVEMNPGEQAIPFQPLIVATSSKAIIDNHSGIFTQPLLRFLIPYIALIETKLALNPTEDIERKQRALAK